jgi:hypothetical protein
MHAHYYRIACANACASQVPKTQVLTIAAWGCLRMLDWKDVSGQRLQTGRMLPI